jgi:hypothetical protein
MPLIEGARLTVLTNSPPRIYLHSWRSQGEAAAAPASRRLRAATVVTGGVDRRVSARSAADASGSPVLYSLTMAVRRVPVPPRLSQWGSKNYL